MADYGEIFKSITFSIFGAILFYLFWDNIFLNLINFAGYNFMGSEIADTTSFLILKSFAWVSFILIYLATVPLYLIFGIMSGSRNESAKTKPLELLKAIGCWSIMVIFVTLIFMIMSILISNLPVITMTGVGITGNSYSIDNSEILNGMNIYAWLLVLICVIGMYLVPFYFVLKGYGQLGDKKRGKFND